MTQNAPQFFSDCLYFHQELKKNFKQFCSMCFNSLNGNEHFPGVSFKVSDDENTAELHALDQIFKISFHIAHDDTHSLGALNTVLTTNGKEDDVLLHSVYFDRLGNVKEHPNSDFGMNSINEKEFLRIFLNNLAQKYLKYLKES